MGVRRLYCGRRWRPRPLKGNQRRFEYELLARLREVLPEGVKVTVVADRGFADCKLFYALATELDYEYVIRLRGDVYGDERAWRATIGGRVGRRWWTRAAVGGGPGDGRARIRGRGGRVCT